MNVERPKRAILLPLILGATACVSIDAATSRDDCVCVTVGGLEADCDAGSFSVGAICIETNGAPGCPKIGSGTVKLGADMNGDGQLQDGEVSREFHATPGTSSWKIGSFSGSIPGGAHGAIMDVEVTGDNGKTIYKNHQVAT
jgi:hypothetical protein